MACNTPSVRVRNLKPARPGPAVNAAAVLPVAITRAVGSTASAALQERAAAARRCRQTHPAACQSLPQPLAALPPTCRTPFRLSSRVPAAASARLFPSRQQSTKGCPEFFRQTVDLLVQNRLDLARAASETGCSGGAGVGRLLAITAGRTLRAFRAVRRATPCSQLASESPLRIESPLRARTRNVA